VDKEQITPGRIREVIREVMSEISSERKAPAAAKGSERTAVERHVSTGKSSERSASERRVSAGRGSERKAPAASVEQAPSKFPCSVAVGADHGGFKLKESLKKYLEEELGVVVKDFGTQSEESVDYPDFALAVARAVGAGECEKGIVIDTMGIGSSIAANKLRGVRAALCHDVLTARSSRGHNDANVLALGSKVVNPGLARTIVRAWLSTSFEGGRHGRRVQKIVDAEKA
jgi:ribose 5-phosphate isomerase B